MVKFDKTYVPYQNLFTVLSTESCLCNYGIPVAVEVLHMATRVYFRGLSWNQPGGLGERQILQNQSERIREGGCRFAINGHYEFARGIGLDGIPVLEDRQTQEIYAELSPELFDPGDASTSFPRIPMRTKGTYSTVCVDRITYRGHIRNLGAFQREGVYRYKKATLIVQQKSEKAQLISVSAPTPTALCTIYSKVRQGKLRPVEDWDARETKNKKRT